MPIMFTLQLSMRDQLYTQVTIVNAYEAQQKKLHLSRAAQERAKLANMLSEAGRPRLSETCSICLEELRLDQPSPEQHRVVVLTDCMHCFHLKCISKWNSVTRSCPLCQRTLQAVEDMQNSHAYTCSASMPWPSFTSGVPEEPSPS